jgi:hypothetical protein
VNRMDGCMIEGGEEEAEITEQTERVHTVQ